MVITCVFGELADKMIQDQLFEKTNSSRIREHLLLETELTLQKAEIRARQIESAMAEAQIRSQGILLVTYRPYTLFRHRIRRAAKDP